MDSLWKKIAASIVAGIFTLSLTSCATIMGEKSQTIGLKSTPGGATVKIVDENSSEVFVGETPTTVTLDKSDGSYWGGKRYSVEVTKSGFETMTFEVKATANGWYLFGNLLFGGIIGWFIVDPFSGAMYNLTPEQIDATLPDATTMIEKNGKRTLSIVLVENVPKELLPIMKRLN
ncbi:MAG: hypothetical protein C0608_05040 [Deltaproteobacteria bacterium]|nr:MAG: hypothetical protein C0608_05040 [Deltaproteobacteria bacterium]